MKSEWWWRRRREQVILDGEQGTPGQKKPLIKALPVCRFWKIPWLDTIRECLSETYMAYSDAASRWTGGALAHPEFRSSINPITTRGADYAHRITASPPGFENPQASLAALHTWAWYGARFLYVFSK